MRAKKKTSEKALIPLPPAGFVFGICVTTGEVRLMLWLRQAEQALQNAPFSQNVKLRN
jgi:hypothetical protein